MQHNRSLYARRDFLKLSSLTIAGAALSPWPRSAFAGPGQIVGLSAAYAQRMPRPDESVRLIPAESLILGDSSFLGRDARVTIRSSARPATALPTAESVALDVVFPANGCQPAAFPAYHAWSRRVDGCGDYASAPVSFPVPVGGTDGLHLRLLRAGTTTAEDLLLELGSASGTPKLQRGLYVIAYSASGEPLKPNWRQYAISSSGNDVVVSDARFAYVVLSIDYAR